MPAFIRMLLLRCCAAGLLAFGLPGPARAQHPDPRLDAINRDIWMPFSRAWAALDDTAYLRLHTADFVRVSAGGPFIGGLAAYAAQEQRFFSAMRAQGSTVRISFRFLERIANDSLASERGIYETIIQRPGGAPAASYGKFHVIHRRTAAGWRILVDYDSDEGGTIGAESFRAAKGMEE
ncbi:MAG: nuclear transport factor 2 family protein [Bacteroidia bacterium]|nr:nuclear transport factor 2 family protein [Bacteroidia bacterium]